jgi:hypothetical protein
MLTDAAASIPRAQRDAFLRTVAGGLGHAPTDTDVQAAIAAVSRCARVPADTQKSPSGEAGARRVAMSQSVEAVDMSRGAQDNVSSGHQQPFPPSWQVFGNTAARRATLWKIARSAAADTRKTRAAVRGADLAC